MPAVRHVTWSITSVSFQLSSTIVELLFLLSHPYQSATYLYCTKEKEKEDIKDDEQNNHHCDLFTRCFNGGGGGDGK
jgi:hypothetical protein